MSSLGGKLRSAVWKLLTTNYVYTISFKCNDEICIYILYCVLHISMLGCRTSIHKSPDMELLLRLCGEQPRKNAKCCTTKQRANNAIVV